MLRLCSLLGMINGVSKAGERPPGYSLESLPEGFDEGVYLILLANFF